MIQRGDSWGGEVRMDKKKIIIGIIAIAIVLTIIINVAG